MYFSSRSIPSAFNLDEFLSKLKKTLLKCSDFLGSVSDAIPHWAANCAHLLYTEKGVPPPSGVHEAGKLYLTYQSDDPSAVTLIGTSKDQKPIQRKLRINTKQASNLITLTSVHVDFATGRSFCCEGKGHSFKSALDHYFSTSFSDKDGYHYHTDSNVHQEGDAFLLPKVIRSKGSESWVDDIVKTLKKLFDVFPPEKHPILAQTIKKCMRTLDQAITTQKMQHYDPRLWVIIMSICQHFDPLTGEDQAPRQRLREFIVAESCRKLMKDEDVIPGLAAYFEALQMHCEIIAVGKENNSEEALVTLSNEYQKKCLYPEIPGHREQIGEHHARCIALQKGENTHKPAMK